MTIEVFGAGLTTLAVVVSHLIYNQHLRDVERRIDRRFNEINRRFDQQCEEHG